MSTSCDFCEDTKLIDGRRCIWCAVGSRPAVRAPKAKGGAFPLKHDPKACQCCDGKRYWVDENDGGRKVPCGPCGATGVLPQPDYKTKQKGKRRNINLRLGEGAPKR
jgi:hypothetical protein